jgi:hypothetical protein
LKRFVLYPFLFILYAILIPLTNNLSEVDISLAVRPLAALLAAAAVALLLFYAVTRDWQYAGYLLFLALIFFLMFGHVYRLIQEQFAIEENRQAGLFLLGIWAVVLGMLSPRRVWVRLGGRTWMPAFLNLVFALALVRPGYQIAAYLLREPLQARASSGEFVPNTGTVPLDCSYRPDIYLIFLDAYGRADVLDGLYGLDNRPFLDSLERKGFYVAAESRSNYTQTIFSIPSMLNFTYIEPTPEGVEGRVYFSSLVKDSKIMRSLKSCGYRTVAIESGFSFTDHPEVDVYLSSETVLNEFESLLMAGSPVEVIGEKLNQEPSEFSYDAHRRRVLYGFEKLAEIPRMPGPKVVFAHIIAPHPPFIFDAGGGAIEPSRGYSIGDGSDFKGTTAEYRLGYAGQVQFVNAEVEKAVDAILEKSKNPPIIIIQGDHGPGSGLDWESPERTCLWERASILNAYYFPDGASSRLYPSITPVNSLRLLLNTTFKAGLPLLPDRSYFTSHMLKDQVIDINEKTGSKENCEP